MSVLIKGMEMPTSCEKCPFLDYEQGFCFASAVKNESGWCEPVLCPGEIKDGRHNDCPLVPVPPHGDLIDRDKFRKTMFIGKQCLYSWDEIEDAIDYAPTVIPASEEGE